jgi:hypothetical protein
MHLQEVFAGNLRLEIPIASPVLVEKRKSDMSICSLGMISHPIE